jgi:hypothetical protein
MNKINVADDRISRLVDELFGEPLQYGEYGTNPVTGGHFIHGADPLEPQKEAARRALRAREWFAFNGPADAQPFPVSYTERERLKGSGVLLHILAWYARSLESRDYDVKEHPPFADYVSGVLWEAELPAGSFAGIPNYPPDEIRELKKRFPPRMLKGMSPGLYLVAAKEARGGNGKSATPCRQCRSLF